MRNLLEFPITYQEKLDILTRLYNDNLYEKTGRIGDMTPLLLKEIYADLVAYEGIVNDNSDNI